MPRTPGKKYVKKRTVQTREKVRKVYTDDWVDADEFDSPRSFSIEDKLSSDKFSAQLTLELDGKDFNLEWVQKNGFCTPLVFHSKENLGLKVPDSNFSINDVRLCVGSRRTLDVMDVNSQKNTQMSMKDWQTYFEDPNKQQLLNVISLEFSHTKLERFVEAPTVVRQLDWVDSVWPRQLKELQTESTNVLDEMMYPKVQKYCLMSVKGCYTDFHIDFGGTSVWYHVLRGMKYFWLIPPTEANIELYERWVLSGKQADVFFGDTVPQCSRVCLHSGDTFFIPTGWIHAVFTPEDSLVFGGNFLHSFNIEKQLRISKMEDLTKVEQKYRYPFFTEMQWYVLERYVSCLLCRSHIDLGLDDLAELSATLNPQSPALPHHVHLTPYELHGIKSIVVYLHGLPASRKSVPELLRDPISLLCDVRELVQQHRCDSPALAVTGRPALQWPDDGQALRMLLRGYVKCSEEEMSTQGDGVKKGPRIIRARPGRRRVKCKECQGCRTDDCRRCINCLDMIKYGGAGVMKQSCKARRCLKPQLPHSVMCSFCGSVGRFSGSPPDTVAGLQLDSVPDCLFECCRCFNIAHIVCTVGQAPDRGVGRVQESAPSTWLCPSCLTESPDPPAAPVVTSSHNGGTAEATPAAVGGRKRGRPAKPRLSVEQPLLLLSVAASHESSSVTAASHESSVVAAASHESSSVAAASHESSVVAAASHESSAVAAASHESSVVTAASHESSAVAAASHESSVVAAASHGLSAVAAASHGLSAVASASHESSVVAAASHESSVVAAASHKSSAVAATSHESSVVAAASHGLSAVAAASHESSVVAAASHESSAIAAASISESPPLHSAFDSLPHAYSEETATGDMSSSGSAAGGQSLSAGAPAEAELASVADGDAGIPLGNSTALLPISRAESYPSTTTAEGLVSISTDKSLSVRTTAEVVVSVPTDNCCQTTAPIPTADGYQSMLLSSTAEYQEVGTVASQIESRLVGNGPFPVSSAFQSLPMHAATEYPEIRVIDKTLSVPDKLESTQVPVIDESQPVPDKMESSSAPVIDEFQSVPGKLESSSVPVIGELESTPVPAIDESQSVPDKLELSPVPAIDDSQPFPDQLESSPVPVFYGSQPVPSPVTVVAYSLPNPTSAEHEAAAVDSPADPVVSSSAGTDDSVISPEDNPPTAENNAHVLMDTTVPTVEPIPGGMEHGPERVVSAEVTGDGVPNIRSRSSRRVLRSASHRRVSSNGSDPVTEPEGQLGNDAVVDVVEQCREGAAVEDGGAVEAGDVASVVGGELISARRDVVGDPVMLNSLSDAGGTHRVGAADTVTGGVSPDNVIAGCGDPDTGQIALEDTNTCTSASHDTSRTPASEETTTKEDGTVASTPGGHYRISVDDDASEVYQLTAQRAKLCGQDSASAGGSPSPPVLQDESCCRADNSGAERRQYPSYSRQSHLRLSPALAPPNLLSQQSKTVGVYDAGVLVAVFSLLSPADVCSCALVCRVWSAVTAMPSVWRRVALSPAGRKLTTPALHQLVRRQPEQLCVSDCRQLQRQQLVWLLGRLERLRGLGVAGQPMGVVSALRTASTGCQALTALDLSRVPRLSDMALLDLLAFPAQLRGRGRPAAAEERRLRLPCLEQLQLSDTDVTDLSCELLTQYAPRLRQLRLDGCCRLTDAGPAALSLPGAPQCCHLARLDLRRCSRLTDLALEHLGRCSGLLQLHVTSSAGVTQRGVQQLCEVLPQLNILLLPEADNAEH